MTQKSLLERLNFQGEDVYLDDKVVFSVPHINTVSGINMLGVSEESSPHGGRIYVGSGKCCYGIISVLDHIPNPEDKEAYNFCLKAIMPPDFNVYDIIPAVATGGFDNSDTMLTTGYGCAGAGVRLMGISSPKTIEVISKDEFNEIWGSRQVSMHPRLTIHQQSSTISLDYLRAGYRLKPGRSRNPRLPTLLIDDSYEPFVSQDVFVSRDLTPVLRDIGVDIEKTIERNKDYTRIRNF